MKFKFLIAGIVLFLGSILFLFFYPERTYAHDNANSNCIHVPNQWVSCGSANFCNGPDLVNNWEVCFIKADGVTHTGCYTNANDLHQANAPQCKPDCNAGIWCNQACSAPPNTCGPGNGSQGDCAYTTHTSGAECNLASADSQPCTIDNCSEGYSCSENTCIANAPPPTPTATPVASVPTATSTPTGAPPTPTVTSTVTRQPTNTNNTPIPSSAPSATLTITGPRATLTSVPPTRPLPSATPTPSFNPDSCKCDGIEYSNLADGQQATITSFGKVEGSDIPKSQIVNQTFYLYEGAETMAKRIMASSPIAASIVSQGASRVRYKSVWQFTMPALKSGATYRIQSVINCQPKATTYNYNPTRNVLGTSNAPFFGGILNFFQRLFGLPNNTVQAPLLPTPTPVTLKIQESQPVELNISQDQLQLGTFQPASVYQKTCSFIKFRVGLQ